MLKSQPVAMERQIPSVQFRLRTVTHIAHYGVTEFRELNTDLVWTTGLEPYTSQ